jgi:hypothetical protein
MVRELVSEVVGMSPYERRLLDMLKTGGAGSEKRMYKFAKRRVSFCLHSLAFNFVCIVQFTSGYVCFVCYCVSIC